MKRMFNPTNKEVSFRYGGKEFIFKPKESRELEEHIADHAVERSKSPLVEHTPMYDRQVEIKDTVYSKMGWREVQRMASARGLFKLGMSREKAILILEEYDASQRGTV